jgi:hypothetical protein
VSDRIIYSGDAGTRFTNETGRVLYQFIAALQNTCGLCLQYHLKISAAWPIPMHWGCRCIQRMIKPGQEAPHEFCDYRALLDAMPEHDKAAAIGASNYRLLKSGLAKWEDIVTANRVRDFREVVAKKRLTVKQMVAHGVKPYQAQQAYSAVHTTEHQAAEAHRRELLQKLTGAGLSQENLVNELSKRLAARVTVAAGPTGPYTSGPAWSGGPLPGGGGSSAAELGRLIAGWKPKRQKAAMPKAPEQPEEKKPEPKPPTGQPVDVDLPIEERLRRSPAAPKVDEMSRLADEIQAANDVRDAEHQKLLAFMESHPGLELKSGDPTTEKLLGFERRYGAAVDRVLAAKAKAKESVEKLLNIPEADRNEWVHRDGKGAWKKSKLADQRKEALGWLEPKIAKGPTPMAPASARPVTWNSGRGRAFARLSDLSIKVSPTGETKTMVHEMGHHLEFSIPGVRQAAIDFLKYRVGDQKPQKLRRIFPNLSYKADEIGCDDDFAKAFGGDKNSAWYAGKHYNSGITEIVSMGVERLYDNPIGFAKGDPEYCKFILGILDGSIRKP